MRPQPTTNAPRKHVYQPDPLHAPPPPELTAILDRYRGQPDALITVLEEIQDHYGYLPRRDLEYTARELHFPLAQVYGVATFYNLFQLNPPGRVCVRVCTGTACHVSRSASILAQITQHLGIEEDETTLDRMFTLQTVACMGACSLAPVVAINEQVHGRMTPQTAVDLIEQMRDEPLAEVPA